MDDLVRAGADAMARMENYMPHMIYRQIRRMDPRSQLVAVLIATLSTTLLAMFVLSKVFVQAPVREDLNRATGGVVKNKPGAPPLPPPTKIVSLRIYPIKSCRGIEIDRSRLRKTGLTLDRNWMFVSTADHKFMTIRTDSSMTLVDTNIIKEDAAGEVQLEVKIRGTDARVTVPAFPSKDWLEANAKLTTVEIWDQQTDAWEYGDDVNRVFTDFFKKPVALVYKGPTARLNRSSGGKELYGQDVPHHFADVISVQIASEASIKDLNKRLEAKEGAPDALTVERFRPNIIVRGRDDHPWDEDGWKRVRLVTTLPAEELMYKLDLDVVARCARCQVPNVDPDTAEKHPKEPWDELMKFRRVDKGGVAKFKPCFGMLCIPKNEGRLEVGGMLEVLETTSNHLYDTQKFEEL